EATAGGGGAAVVEATRRRSALIDALIGALFETRVESGVLARSTVTARCVEPVTAARVEARCAVAVVEAGRTVAVLEARAAGRRTTAITAETVVGTAGETIATAAAAAEALGLGRALARLQARHHLGLEADRKSTRLNSSH